MKFCNILICGHTGIVGSSILENLKKNKEFKLIGINSKTLNLTNSKLVEVFCKKKEYYDILIFLVGLAHSKGKVKEINHFRSINFLTLKNLLNKLKANNKLPRKIIFASTISVYGEDYNKNTYNEFSKLNPKSPYAITKLESENLLMKEYRSISWVLRFAPIYSNKFQLNIDRRTKIGRFFYRVGDGANIMSLCNIKNIDKVVKSIINNDIPSGIYIVSDKINYTYNTLLKFKKARFILPIPRFIIKILFKLGSMLSNIYLEENSIKLLTNNIYDSSKLSKYIKLLSLNKKF